MALTTVTSSATAVGQCVTRHSAPLETRVWSHWPRPPSWWCWCPHGSLWRGSRATWGRGGRKLLKMMMEHIKHFKINLLNYLKYQHLLFWKAWCIYIEYYNFFSEMRFSLALCWKCRLWKNVTRVHCQDEMRKNCIFQSPVFHSIKMLAAEHL